MILSNKKGNIIFDIIMFIIVIFVATLISFFGWQVWSDLEPDIKSDVNITEGDNTIDEVTTRYPSFIDGLILFIFLGMWTVGVISAFTSDTHPILFGVMMIALVFVIIAGTILGNFYEDLFADAELSTIASNFTATNWILSHMLIIGIVVGLSIVLAFFGKNRGQG